jgi:hypothetical protein
MSVFKKKDPAAGERRNRKRQIFLAVCGAGFGAFAGYNYSDNLVVVGLGACIGALGAYYYG